MPCTHRNAKASARVAHKNGSKGARSAESAAVVAWASGRGRCMNVQRRDRLPSPVKPDKSGMKSLPSHGSPVLNTPGPVVGAPSPLSGLRDKLFPPLDVVCRMLFAAHPG